MTDPMYLSCTAFAMFFRHCVQQVSDPSEQHVLYLRQYRTGTVYGSRASKSLALGYPFWVAIIMGSITELPEVYCVTYSSTKFR